MNSRVGVGMLCFLLAALAPTAAWADSTTAAGTPEATRSGNPGASGPVLPDASGSTQVSGHRDDLGANVLGPTADPEFAPSSTQLGVAAVGFNKDGATVKASVRPLKLTGVRPLWGLEFAASANSDRKSSSVGVSYRFEYRWLFEHAFAQEIQGEFERLSAACLAGTLNAACKAGANGKVDTTSTVDRELVVASHYNMFTLLPVLTVGSEVGFFLNDPTKAAQSVNSSQSVVAKLDWRLGVMLEFASTLAFSRERATLESKNDYAAMRSTSASLVWVLPWLVGADYYDKEYLSTQFQRGVGIGGAITLKNCLEGGTSIVACKDGVLSNRFFGAILDLRLSKDIRPRFTFGERLYEVNGRVPSSLAGFEFNLLLAAVLN